MAPVFSVIIPSFNQGNFIGQTIDSILNQSYKNVEILVIDGGSTDQTIGVLEQYEKRIYWISEKDRGQTHAINKGIVLAKGDIITYLNSDDYYLDGALEKVVAVFQSNKDALWVTGDYEIVDEQGKSIQSPIAQYKSFFRKRLSFNLLSVLNPIIQPSTFLHHDLVRQAGLFNEALRYTMDYEYWMRAIRIQKPVMLDDKLSAFRIHKKSKGGSQFRRQFDEELQVAKKYQRSAWLLFLHALHNRLIGLVYAVIK